MNHARVNVQGYMKFLNHSRGGFGGAVRLGELTLVRVILALNMKTCYTFRLYMIMAKNLQ